MSEPTEEQLQQGSNRYATLMLAIYDVSWYYRPVTISTRGTHINWTEIATGLYVFNDSEEAIDDFIAWSKALRARKANAPTPEPPEKYKVIHD